MKRLLTLVASITVAVILVCWAVPTGSAKPAVWFSHRLHITEVEAACEDCHAAAASATVASVNLLPELSICGNCHDPGELPGFNYSPDIHPAREIIFSHSRHVDTLQLGCGTCHAGIEKAATAGESVLPAMSVCTDCHRARQLATECSVCHTHVELRRPADHVADWILDHSEVAWREAPGCADCHQSSYCQECHDGAALGLAIRGTAGVSRERIGPLGTTQTGGDLLILQRAHELNYRYTHGVEVKSKLSDCSVCHETVSFCVACHDPGSGESSYRPVWHDLSDFRLGRHAEFARNDIEVCAGCHESSGAEPACLQCHQRIVSPHPDGFMKDNKGTWHDDPNAVCFVCHEDGNRRPGVGFCGQCHGHNPD